MFEVGKVSPGGAGRNRVLNKKQFLDIRLNLPGIKEQEKIASLLNLADAEIGLLAALREKIEIFKRGLLSKLLSGELHVLS